MSEHTVGPNQIRGVAARLCWEHPGYGEFISKKDASDALHRYADEMEADTVRQAASDLLEAGRAMLQYYDAFVKDNAAYPGETEMYADPLRAAIAKAEGLVPEGALSGEVS